MAMLRLDVEALVVESFDTTAGTGGRRGTVRGFAATDTTCLQRICAYNTKGEDTCWLTCGGCYETENVSCDGSCQISCEGTCNGGETCDPGCDTYQNCPTHYTYMGCC